MNPEGQYPTVPKRDRGLRNAVTGETIGAMQHVHLGRPQA